MKTSKILSCLFLILSCGNADSIKNNTTITRKDTTRELQPLANPYAAIDVSPMDMAYFPIDFPVQKMAEAVQGLPVARVIYSRPHRQGRKVFGELLKYGEPWRLGANEATEIEFFKDVTIQNKKVIKGRYVLYCIPQPDNWTIVFNSNTFSWGLKPDPQKDLFKFEIPAQHTTASVEYFTMVFEPSAAGADLIMTWDDVLGRLPITIK